MYPVAPSAELGIDVARQEPRVAAGGVDVDVLAPEQGDHDVPELGDELDLVQEHVVHPVVADEAQDVLQQRVRVAQALHRAVVESQSYHVVFGDPFGQQTVAEQLEQQVRLAAPPDAGDHLDASVALPRHELVQVPVPLDLHGAPP